ncbi:MAG TPA: cohesin domain-containing protein [Candidatus Limnocylindrales bacterium]|nr:cohesin domain-containing protein [Candidatus Limnocylindrales bacterium]
MPKKTLALISGLVLVTVILFVIALRSNQKTAPTNVKPTGEAVQASPTVSVAHSVLSLSPNPVNVLPGGAGKVEVELNTSDNPVTAVQLELSYDPKSVRNVQITPGPLFANGAVIINKNNPATGKFTYAVGITPSQTPVKGTGVVATITFTGVAAGTSQLTLLPTTLVTARGIATSVLKSSTGTQVIVGSGGGVSLPATQSSPSAGL